MEGTFQEGVFRQRASVQPALPDPHPSGRQEGWREWTWQESTADVQSWNKT